MRLFTLTWLVMAKTWEEPKGPPAGLDGLWPLHAMEHLAAVRGERALHKRVHVAMCCLLPGPRSKDFPAVVASLVPIAWFLNTFPQRGSRSRVS